MSSRPVVLVPADRTTNVERVTNVAIALAAPGAADIHVLDVTPRIQPWHALENQHGRPRVLGETGRPEEGTVRGVRLRGKAERIIPAYAQLTGARAVVVDRHYGASPRWPTTALVARLSRGSPVPVLVLPSDGPALERLAGGNISRVVAAVDSTLASAVALRTAVDLAARHDARVTLLHALENFLGHSVFSGSEAWRLVQQLPSQQRQVASRLESRARRFGQVDTDARVVTGDAASGIVSAASDADADVIVMGVAPRTWRKWTAFGSTLDAVLRRAGMPVLVIPVVGGEEEWSETTIVEAVSRGVPSEFTTARIAA